MTTSINHFAAIAAALSTFLIGGLWYSPLLFQKAWMRENNFTDDSMKNGSPGKIFGLSFLFSLVMAYNLAFFVGDPSISADMAAVYGLLTGLGWVTMAIFIIGLFERRSVKYLLINGGYMVVAFTVMGLILGLWR